MTKGHIQTITNTVVLLTSSITNIEQIVSTFSTKMVAFPEVDQNFSVLTARMFKVETCAASASSVSSSARSWPSPGQVDGSTAAGSHDPGSSENRRNTRRRLDTISSPDAENARSAVLLRFRCDQCHAGVSAWLKEDTCDRHYSCCRYARKDSLQNWFHICSTRIWHESQMSRMCGNIQRQWPPVYS